MVKKQFKRMRVKEGPDYTYLGMQITRRGDDVVVSMTEYESKILEEWKKMAQWKTDRKAVTPSTADLFIDDSSSPLCDAEKAAHFHTGVAKLLYLSKRTRIDLLTTTSVSAGKVQEPRILNWDVLDRLYAYLNGNRDLTIVFKGGVPLVIDMYGDAAYMVHNDLMSRSGMIALVNGGCFATLSCKQKFIVKSSTEAEFMTMSEVASMALYVNEFMKFQMENPPVITMYQDNQSVIALLKANNCGLKGSKHIKVRYFFVKQHIESGEIKIMWCGTKDMLADLMTKPLLGQLFKDMIARLLVPTLKIRA